jgi:23S rRNA (uracil1939-C5)-methyltransferase
MPTTPPLRRGQRISIDVEDLSYLGDGVGHLDGKLVVFVTGALPGERIVAEVDERRPHYVRAHVVDLIEASPERVQPPCPYFGRCGGCQVQHLDYEAQLAWKTASVSHQLRRIGHLDPGNVRPTIGAGHPWNYRNNARFSVDAEGRLGFAEPSSHRHLAVDDCQLMQPEIVAVMPRLQRVHPGAHQIVVRYGARTGQLLIDPPVDLADIGIAVKRDAYEDVLLGRTYRVSAPSFFQVNTRVDRREVIDALASEWRSRLADGYSMAELLVALVLDRLALTGAELVVDAYCGVGTFSLPIAERAREVIGVEEARSAVLDAEHNAAGLVNAQFLVGRTEDVLGSLDERPDAVVLDPSRVGCDPRVLAALANLRPSRLVYVSCDVATLARDLARLVASGFELVEVQPIDMFPQTHHVETVSQLRWTGIR